MQTILIAEGDDRVARSCSPTSSPSRAGPLPPTMPASARSTRSLAVLLTTRYL
jgi:hypothetical protein